MRRVDLEWEIERRTADGVFRGVRIGTGGRLLLLDVVLVELSRYVCKAKVFLFSRLNVYVDNTTIIISSTNSASSSRPLANNPSRRRCIYCSSSRSLTISSSISRFGRACTLCHHHCRMGTLMRALISSYCYWQPRRPCPDMEG